MLRDEKHPDCRFVFLYRVLCVKFIVEGKQGIGTFNLPYFSQRQPDQIGKIPILSVFRDDEEIVSQVSRRCGGFPDQ